MKHTFLILFLTFFGTMLSASPLKVKIDNLKDKEIYVGILSIEGKLLKEEVIPCEKGSFIYENNFDIPIQLEMTPSSGLLDTKRIRGVVKRETMTIKIYLASKEGCTIRGAYKNGVITYKVEGSEGNQVLADMRNKYIEMYRYFDMEDEYFRDDKTKEERDSVYKIGEEIQIQQDKEKLSYIEANLNKELSGLFFSEVSIEDARMIYPLLAENVVNGLFKSIVKNKKYTIDLLMNSSKNGIGETAHNFTLKGLDGMTVKLSDLKGQYVFIYFWGSWCHWCLQDVAKLNKLKTQYDGKVEFVGIVSRDTETTLKTCVKEKGILWNSYFEKDINSGEDVSFLYGVTGFPHKVLIDPDGKIALICAGSDSDFYEIFNDYMEDK